MNKKIICSACFLGNSFKRILSFSLYLSLLAFHGSAQTPDSWSQKADFGGNARNEVCSFSIGDKGYFGTGVDGATNKQDFWEWNQTSNVWTQKADFGGGGRAGAVGFSIGTKGYIGTGDYLKDFWEWDQADNIWIRKSDFGGLGRAHAVGFSIGNKGYIGTGDNGAGYFQDFWEWDKLSDTWTQKANFGGTARSYASGFSIGTKGYIGIGDHGGGYEQDFWEWDQGTNSWTQKADFGGGIRAIAVSFAIGAKGYMGLGYNLSNGQYYKDFWEWDQSTNVWLRKTDFGGTARVYGKGFSIGSKGYVGTGLNVPIYYQDFWEYTPPCPGTLEATAGPDKTVYYGYIPNQCVSLAGSATGGVPPYQYLWSNGAASASTSVCPAATTTYTLMVTDAIGCVQSDEVIVNVIDVRCGKNKVKICHKEKMLCVSSADVQDHLAHGDYLGDCNISARVIFYADSSGVNIETPLELFPNPTTGLFTIEVCKKNVVTDAKIQVVNSNGQVVYSKTPFKSEGYIKETIGLNPDLAEGVYFMNLIIEDRVETRKLILIKNK